MAERRDSSAASPFKGKGARRSFRYVRAALDEAAGILEERFGRAKIGAGLDQRMSGLNGAKRRLQKIALRLADEFRVSYPGAGVTLGRNSHASNSFLRWRFTTEALGKGGVRFSDDRIAAALSQFDESVALDWLAFETQRLRLNHVLALILYEEKRLALLKSEIETVRAYKRVLRRREEI